LLRAALEIRRRDAKTCVGRGVGQTRVGCEFGQTRVRHLCLSFGREVRVLVDTRPLRWSGARVWWLVLSDF